MEHAAEPLPTQPAPAGAEIPAGECPPCACVDIGSNTTRLLVAAAHPAGLRPLAERRAFTSIAAAQDEHGMIPAGKLDEVVAVVAEQLQAARDLGTAEVRVVATAGVRRAPNREDLTVRLRRALGVELEILGAVEEARLAFIGAAAMHPGRPQEPLAVVDLGGGSCEVAVGRVPDQVEWVTSLPIGSALLARVWGAADPPGGEELERARATVARELQQVMLPRTVEAIAVGGSATSLRRLVGEQLDRLTLATALEEVSRRPAGEVAAAHGLELERARLLPAGLVILQELARALDCPLGVGRGGLREGILLEALR